MTSPTGSAGSPPPTCLTRSTPVSTAACSCCADLFRTALLEPTMLLRNSSPTPIRGRTVIACNANGQPRTYRLARAAQHAAYRRLAVAILGLDVATLAHELRTVLPHAA